ncbi:amino acid deaminase [Pseudoalteromonas fenneropenaei]|uniref:Amino acid deaminase n=1 Tax=Pseudoalteromonas fenneropenaei TaxID=1737459 RepID=A0ABV7CJG2_9GAMM
MKKISVQDLSTICRNNKGLGHYEQFYAQGWNLAHHDVSLPAAVIYADNIAQNIQWMADFAAHHQVKLAPHGKTTMIPALFKQQLAAGAYAITVATPHQARAAITAGAKRILMANQLVGKANMRAIANLLKSHEVEFYCLVDSAANVSALNDFFANQQLKLKVLVELGVPQGRCGLIDAAECDTLIAAVQAAPALQLAGIELYEGVLNDLEAIKTLLDNAVQYCLRLHSAGAFGSDTVLLTAGGSAYYDLVCEAFNRVPLPGAIVPLIRPGCYISHDMGIYQQAQNAVLARSQMACSLQGELVSALEIWAYVQSVPEPGRAIIGMGKRDVAFDAGMPKPVRQVTQSGEIVAAQPDWQVERMMDQHAMMRFAPAANVQVGDIIAFATSHPCLTFDKWRYLNVVNAEFEVVDIYATYF